MTMNWTDAQAAKWEIPKTPGSAVGEATRKELEIADLKLCLAGNPASERWKLLKIELTRRESELLVMKRRLAGRTPQMESWADPLPG